MNEHAPKPDAVGNKKSPAWFFIAVAAGLTVLVLAYLVGGPTTRVVATCVVLTTLGLGLRLLEMRDCHRQDLIR